MGIELSPNDELKIPVYNAETMETNVKGLFLAGVVCGRMQTHKWFIENSRIHATMIMVILVLNKGLPSIRFLFYIEQKSRTTVILTSLDVTVRK